MRQKRSSIGLLALYCKTSAKGYYWVFEPQLAFAIIEAEKIPSILTSLEASMNYKDKDIQILFKIQRVD